VLVTLNRLAATYQFVPHIDIGPKGISVALDSKEKEPNEFTVQRNLTGIMGVNFKVISGISRMSWQVVEEPWTLEKMRNELNRLCSLPHYNRWLVLLLVGIAGASFCFTFGGKPLEMCIAFCATFAGLFTKQELNKRAFNPYIITFIAAFVACSLVGICQHYFTDAPLVHALATSVLFLVPGVPFINAVNDLIDGFILNGIERGVNALLFAFAIAFGLSAAIYLFKMYT